MSVVPTPQEFMEKVVAWPGSEEPGYVNLHWTSPKGPGMRGKPFKDLHEFMNMAQYAATKAAVYKECYFCLSTQSATGKVIHGNATAARLKQNALKLKSIWLDIDVKPTDPKCYSTLGEAFDGLNAFRAAAKLPAPSALVLSGGGIHVYWISNTALSPSEWRPFAEGLKSEAVRLGFKCDHGLTTDEARVLRVPGTYNNKTLPPRPVKLAHLGDQYDFERDLAHIKSAAPVGTSHVTATVSGAALHFDISAFAGVPMAPAFAAALPNPQFDSLAQGIALRSDLPLKVDEVFTKCPHFTDAVLTNGAAHSQPLWALTLLASTWFEDGREWAHYMSKGYPSYDKGETDAKFDEKLRYKANGTGWPSCQAFEAAGCTKCKTCPFYGKLKSPLNLAERAQPPTIVAAAPPPPDDLFLPMGYTTDPTTGYICEIVQKNLTNGVTVEELAPLFMCKLRNPNAQRGTRKWMFETSLDAGTWGPVSLLEEDLATEQALMKSLRRQGVKPYPRNKNRLEQFMTAWMAKYDDAKKRLNTISFGWLRKDEGGEIPVGFAYGGRVVLNDGTEQVAGFSDDQIERIYKPRGDAALWREALKIVTEQGHPDLETIIAMSFAAPLMYATGHYNGVFCAWSPEAGTHKSTSIGIGQSVWGNPSLAKEKPLSSQKGLIRKIGHIKNLPVYWDEISEEEKMDEVRVILSYLTEGGDGNKLRTDRTLFDVQDWQTLMLVGSNRSLAENIMKNVSDTDAKLQRVFEFRVPQRPDTRPPHEVARLINALDYNYGHMGLHYSTLLGRDPKGIYDFTGKIVERFNHEVDHQSPERFRSAMAATVFAGASLANQIGCDFHLEEMWPWLKQQYMGQRTMIAQAETVGGTAAHTANTLSQFFKFCVRNCLWVQSLPMRQKGKPDAIAWLAGPTAQRPERIEVRLSVSDRIIDISKKRLGDYMAMTKGSVGAVVKGMITHFGAEQVEKVDLSTGAGVAGGRETVMRLRVPAGSPFEGILFRQSPMDDRPLATEDESAVTAPVSETGISDALAKGAEVAAQDLAKVRES